MSLAWLLNEPSAYATRTLAIAASYNFIVPANWPLEVATGLLRAERRGRIESADTAWSLLMALRIDTEPMRANQDVPTIMAAARRFSLTGYDAAYLHLALGQKCPLATLDAALQGAASAAGVTLL